MIRARVSLLVLAGLALCGCDGQQYVSPDTVALSVRSDATGTELLSRCHFVPVLLGSRVKARYLIEDELSVVISLDRAQLELSYDEPGREYSSFSVPTPSFEEGATQIEAADPPDGYRVQLSSPCTPLD